jgi:hypothetical protein
MSDPPTSKTEVSPPAPDAGAMAKFQKWGLLPMELKREVTARYIQLERVNGNLEKVLHYDDWGNPCCVWKWPHFRILCDKKHPSELPPTWMAPWLPNLAFIDHETLKEVACTMFLTTEYVDFKYIQDHPFKITNWFSTFLDTIKGWNSLTGVCFPHFHRYNPSRADQLRYLENPDVKLMRRCKNLQRAHFTFHASALTKVDPNDVPVHKTVDEVIKFYQLGPIIDCDQLKYVHLDGILPGWQVSDEFPENLLKTLQDLGNLLFDKYGEVRTRAGDSNQ